MGDIRELSIEEFEITQDIEVLCERCSNLWARKHQLNEPVCVGDVISLRCVDFTIIEGHPPSFFGWC